MLYRLKVYIIVFNKFINFLINTIFVEINKNKYFGENIVIKKKNMKIRTPPTRPMLVIRLGLSVNKIVKIIIELLIVTLQSGTRNQFQNKINLLLNILIISN